MAGLAIAGAKREAIYPLAFSAGRRSGATDIYLVDPTFRKLVEFFETKGLRAVKDEDRREQWYEDWIAYQAAHGLYASVLSPKSYSTLGFEFDLLKLTRFLEVFGYFSPAHGYSLQVTFLGLFSILMGTNSALKQEAVAILESGGLLAFGVSEQSHGADLLANEFTLGKNRPGHLLANGKKYYIGNANAAAMISILGRMDDERSRGKRPPPVLLRLRLNNRKASGPRKKSKPSESDRRSSVSLRSKTMSFLKAISSPRVGRLGMPCWAPWRSASSSLDSGRSESASTPSRKRSHTSPAGFSTENPPSTCRTSAQRPPKPTRDYRHEVVRLPRPGLRPWFQRGRPTLPAFRRRTKGQSQYRRCKGDCSSLGMRGRQRLRVRYVFRNGPAGHSIDPGPRRKYAC